MQFILINLLLIVLAPLDHPTTVSSNLDLSSKLELIEDRGKLFSVFSFVAGER